MPASLSQRVAGCHIATDGQEETLALTRGLARGDEAAWEVFFGAYRQRLEGYLRRCWKGDAPPVDELLQETLLRAVRHVRPFRDEGAFWSWLTVLARSAVADHGRRRSAWWRFLKRYRIHRDAHASAMGASRRDVESALAALDPAARGLLEAKYERGDSVRTLARHAGVTEKVVEHRLAKARKTLAREIRNAGETR